MSGNLNLRVRGVLFDSDGVLVDSHDAAALAWNTWATTWAPGFDFHRDAQHGRRLVDVVADLVADADAEHAAALLTAMELELATEVPAVPGADQLLRSSPPDRWAVVTSGGRGMAAARLKAAGLPAPRVLISADDVERGKPDPDPYLAGARALGLPPDACVVFEDAHFGIVAARAAGARFVVGVGAQTVGMDVDASVADLTDVTFDGSELTIAHDRLLAYRPTVSRVPANIDAYPDSSSSRQ